MGGCWSSLLGSELGELESWLNQLSGLITHDSVSSLDDSLDDEDVFSLGTMSTSHLVVHLRHGSAKSIVSVLLVHVNNISSCSILKYDSVVLHGIGLLLEDLGNGNDLSLDLSNLVLSLHLIPELGSSENDVLGKDSNSIACWLWGSFTWELSSDNPKLLDLYQI